MRRFAIIAITPFKPVKNEAARIAELLESGIVDRVHLRHPELDARAMAAIIEAIPEEMHGRLSLHSHPALCHDFNDIGFHDNSRAQAQNVSRVRSRSCHTLEEVKQAAGYDYVTLSPVFDSISKPGYAGAIDLCSLSLHEVLGTRRVIALGGVTPSHFTQLADAGFAGAAMLGFMNLHDETAMRRALHEIKEYRCCNS